MPLPDDAAVAVDEKDVRDSRYTVGRVVGVVGAAGLVGRDRVVQRFALFRDERLHLDDAFIAYRNYLHPVGFVVVLYRGECRYGPARCKGTRTPQNSRT